MRAQNRSHLRPGLLSVTGPRPGRTSALNVVSAQQVLTASTRSGAGRAEGGVHGGLCTQQTVMVHLLCASHWQSLLGGRCEPTARECGGIQGRVPRGARVPVPPEEVLPAEA